MKLQREGIELEIARSARALLDTHWSLGRLASIDDATWMTTVWPAARDAGWFDVIVPVERGGLGLGPVELGAIFEEAGRSLFPGPLLATACVAGTLRRAADLPERSMFACVGLSSDGNVAPLRLTAHGISGTAIGSYADVADALLAHALGSDGAAIAVIDRAEHGVSVAREPALDLIDRPCMVTFDAARATVIQTGPEAARTLARIEELLWCMIASEVLGCAEALLDLAVAYAKVRNQFGRPIGSFQAVQHRLADMRVLTSTLRSACYVAQVRSATADPGAARAARVAKAYASSVAAIVAESALQVHGGIAFTTDSVVHLLVKHCLALRAAYGDEDAHAIALGRAALQGD